MLAPMLRHAGSLVIATTLALGCVERTSVAPPPPPHPVAPSALVRAGDAAGAAEGGAPKLHIRDGRLVVLDSWRVVGARIVGLGREYGVERELVRSGEV